MSTECIGTALYAGITGTHRPGNDTYKIADSTGGGRDALPFFREARTVTKTETKELIRPDDDRAGIRCSIPRSTTR